VLAPTSSFVPVQDRAFEHRMYLPLAAVLVLAVAGGARIGPGRARTLAPALAGVAALALAALTVRRNHDYRSAVDLMRVTVATAPHHARARIGLGAALLAAGRPQEAVAALDEALRLEPENAFAHMNLGVAYAALEELDRAIPHLEAAVEHLEDPRFLEELGRALFLKGEHAASVPYFERALELDPGNAFLHCRLAYALGESRRTEEALRHYGESLRLEPELQEAHFQIAALLVELGRPAEAVEHGLRALEIAPNTSDEVVALGRAFRAAGRLDDALTAFRMAASLDPARPEPCAAFAETVCAQPGAGLELRREAVRMARAANELTGWKRADLLELCALAEAGAGACAEAARLVEQALELAGPSDDPDLAQRLRSQREDYLRRAGEER
jgi:tetratricopeptide (TPR) repeat protein